MRLARRVADGDREVLAGRVQRQGQGRGHARLDQPDVVVRFVPPRGGQQYRAGALLDGHAELAEAVQVGGDGAVAQLAAARQGHFHRAQARQQRSGERERAAQPAPDGGIDRLRADAGRIDLHGAVAGSRHGGAEAGQDLQVGVHVERVGKLAEGKAAACQRRRRQRAHQRVLVGDGDNLAGQRHPAFDPKRPVHCILPTSHSVTRVAPPAPEPHPVIPVTEPSARWKQAGRGR